MTANTFINLNYTKFTKWCKDRPVTINIKKIWRQDLTEKKLQIIWMKSSDHDFKTMNHLLKSKDYSWALFVGHLVIEKMLKAYYATKLGGYPPHTHNLLKLAENSGLEISLDRKKQLDTITSFNLSTRYDNEKLEFYKKCTRPLLCFTLAELN